MTTTGTVISYPIPLYQNLPIDSDFYQPSQYFIEDISLGQTTTVTATQDVNYVIGQQVRLLIPASFGSYELNGKTAFVIAIPAADQVTLNLDSSLNVSAFIADDAATQPQIISIGDINSGNVGSTGLQNQPTFIPGSFINISPE